MLYILKYCRGAVVASLLFLTVALTVSCDNGKKPHKPARPTVDYSAVAIPEFSADTAFAFLEKQLSFGVRTPGSSGHDACAKYLHESMARWCDTVITQSFSTTLWNNQSVKGVNIIASLNPERSNRILLCAHWDSRLWADHDPDSLNRRKPIMGANDGASGVATLMEMARAMSQSRPSVGIDFIFFDVEDQGTAVWSETDYQDNTWCKGSQYWAQNPHRPYYTAIYGILLDMVATPLPRFTKEEISRHYAGAIMNKLWTVAAATGHASVFVDRNTDAILDDHLYVNQIANIPTVDIVQNSEDCSFFSHWHTLGDNIESVDRKPMKIVADVIMKAIYGDYAGDENIPTKNAD